MTDIAHEVPEHGDSTSAPAAHRLHIDKHGHLVGDAWITRNDPFPCVNGEGGLIPPMRGVIQHTNVGSLPGTVATFNDPGRQASAHFELGGPWSGTETAGRVRIHQFGPVNGWMAWHAEAANNLYFGLEVEDGGHPEHPMTDAQLTAAAQVVEALSAQGDGWGFPLRVADTMAGRGLSAHYLGSAAWGGHTCPDAAPGGQGPRSRQRHEIIRRARILREHGQYPAPVPQPSYATISADGVSSLAQIAAAHSTVASSILDLTARYGPSKPKYDPQVAAYLNSVFAGAVAVSEPVPAGTVLIVPAN